MAGVGQKTSGFQDYALRSAYQDWFRTVRCQVSGTEQAHRLSLKSKNRDTSEISTDGIKEFIYGNAVNMFDLNNCKLLSLLPSTQLLILLSSLIASIILRNHETFPLNQFTLPPSSADVSTRL